MARYPQPSPIQTLPVEILSYIFLLSTPVPIQGGANQGQQQSLSFNCETVKVPLLLASVSRQWRKIARSTPGLWTNICVSLDLLQEVDDGSWSVLNLRPLQNYLALSRNYPLHILIDARDPDWDFSEPEIPLHGEDSDIYVPPFSPNHMKSAITCLLPHLHRWRSLDILTDTWAPMFLALHQIQPFIAAFGAPSLESLSLMRCNDFVSYSPTFQPEQMKTPSLFNLAGHHPSRSSNLLPRLRKLTLRGVHVDWSGLSQILVSNPTPILETLELGSHSLDVRPTFTEFYQILQSAPALANLKVNGSGPGIPEDVDRVDIQLEIEGFKPVSLPALQDLSLGYHTAYESQLILEMLDAPSVRHLSLEDAAHPGEPDPIDASTLLQYVGSQKLSAPQNQRRDPVTGMKTARPHCAGQYSEEKDASAAFPHLESVTLKGVRCCPIQMQVFLDALSDLRHLEFNRMSVDDVKALMPQAEDVSSNSSCPCPNLQVLSIRGCETLPDSEFIRRVGILAQERANRGGCSLREIDIHVDALDGEDSSEAVINVSRAGPTLKIVREASVPIDVLEGYDDVDDYLSTLPDPYRPGGEFNDPIFDTYVASRAISAY